MRTVSTRSYRHGYRFPKGVPARALGSSDRASCPGTHRQPADRARKMANVALWASAHLHLPTFPQHSKRHLAGTPTPRSCPRAPVHRQNPHILRATFERDDRPAPFRLENYWQCQIVAGICVDSKSRVNSSPCMLGSLRTRLTKSDSHSLLTRTACTRHPMVSSPRSAPTSRACQVGLYTAQELKPSS